MNLRVLVTGGAGFIGTKLCTRLRSEGCVVTALDLFTEQIHGTSPGFDSPADFLIRGDVRDRKVLEKALASQDVVVHLAAETGTGQSMYAVTQYETVNIGATALLTELIANQQPRTIRRIIVASSRAVVGEGAYRCPEHEQVYPGPRRIDDMDAHLFEPRCPICGAFCECVPTPEAAPFAPSSFYGLTKQVQEQMVLMFGQALGISAYALRYQNVFGPGQSLHNPYTGILAIFSNLAREGRDINVFEDGQPSRDFVYIDDVVEATWRCVAREDPSIACLNIGTGVRTTVYEVAKRIARRFGSSGAVAISGNYRVGDIRHNSADLSSVRSLLGFEPQWNFEDGLGQFLTWVDSQAPVSSDIERSFAEMRERGLLKGQK